jgi:hypothetical protein
MAEAWRDPVPTNPCSCVRSSVTPPPRGRRLQGFGSKWLTPASAESINQLLVQTWLSRRLERSTPGIPTRSYPLYIFLSENF